MVLGTDRDELVMGVEDESWVADFDDNDWAVHGERDGETERELGSV